MAQPQTVAQAARGLATLFKAGMSTGHEQLLIITKTIMPLMASPLLQQMGLGEGTTEPFALLDGACGSGVVTQEVQRTVPRAVLEGSSIVASDSSEALVDLVRTRVEAEGWVNTEAKVLDAMVSWPCYSSQKRDKVISNRRYRIRNWRRIRLVMLRLGWLFI